MALPVLMKAVPAWRSSGVRTIADTVDFRKVIGGVDFFFVVVYTYHTYQLFLGVIVVIHIEILSSEVLVSRGTSKDGRPFEFHKQEAFVHLGQKYPVRSRIRIEPGKPYQPGIYALAPNSFWVDRYGELRLNPRLVPVRQAEKLVAA